MRARLKHLLVPALVAVAGAVFAPAANGADGIGGKGQSGSARASADGTMIKQGRILVNSRLDGVDRRVGDGRCADRRGRCTLRAAVQEANGNRGMSRIFLHPGRYSLSVSGAGEDAARRGDLDIRGRVAVHGRGATVDARRSDRAFDVQTGSMLQVANLKIIRGAPPSGESGGAIRNAGRTKLVSSRLFANLVKGEGASGGAVFNDGGDLMVSKTWLQRNRATRAGGAIEADQGRTWVHGGGIAANVTGDAPGNGGGIHLTGEGLVDVRGAIVSRNRAAAEGGGLWNSADGTMNVVDTRFADNRASGADPDQGGGALFNDGGRMTVSDSRIVGNAADGESGSGGGILNDGGSLSVAGSALARNSAPRAGGAIEAVAGSTVLSRVVMNSNSAGSAPGNGGALHLTGDGTVSVGDSFVAGNTAAAEGGGLWNSAVGTMLVVRTELIGNKASGDDADQGGGGLFNDGGRMTVEDSDLAGNWADGESGSGGGVLNNDGDLTVIGSSINRNSAPRAGGGIEAVDGVTRLSHVVLRDNGTGANPGNGGGLHLTGPGTVLIDGSRVVRNTAANEGGGLWNSATGTMTVTDTTIKDNSAPTGPQVFNQPPGGTFTLDGVPVP